MFSISALLFSNYGFGEESAQDETIPYIIQVENLIPGVLDFELKSLGYFSPRMCDFCIRYECYNITSAELLLSIALLSCDCELNPNLRLGLGLSTRQQ